MIKRRLLSYDIPQLTKVFKKDFPQPVSYTHLTLLTKA